jgi:murein DD-endopeptidase MepM/ murein hydrolase activator NlpD
LVFSLQIVIGLLIGPAGFSDAESPASPAQTAVSDRDGLTAGQTPVAAASSTTAQQTIEPSPSITDPVDAIGAGEDTAETEATGIEASKGNQQLAGPAGQTPVAAASSTTAQQTIEPSPSITDPVDAIGAGEDATETEATGTQDLEASQQLVRDSLYLFRDAAAIPQPQPTEVLASVVGSVAELPVRVFPVVGGGSFSSSFGAPRPGDRTHKGNDIFAPKMTPIAAVAGGIVVGVSDPSGEECCFAKIEHDDGSRTLYLHLNNDTPGSDDGMGWGIADGIHKGVRVEAGTVIGYVGDSGNAEGTQPHLHFEYHSPGSGAVDPYQMLRAAPVLVEVGAPIPAVTAADTADATELPHTGLSLDWLGLFGIALVAMGVVVLRLSLSLPVRRWWQ